MDKVTSYIKECETEFMQLLGLTSFPIYEIAYKDISLSVSDEQGYDSLGSAHYDYKTGKHTLTVWSNIHTLGEVGKQTIFHEFTHILDDETYVNKDPEKYIANHGYTEYHAAQIGFLKVLGVKSIKQNISFSMSDFIDTESGYMSIQDYVDVIDELKACKNEKARQKYRDEHDSDFIILNAAKRYFDSKGLKKLPSHKALQTEVEQLIKEKNELYNQYQTAKEETQRLDAIRHNLEQTLGRKIEHKKEQER